MFTQNYIEYRKMMFLGYESKDAFVAHDGTVISGSPPSSALSDFGRYMDTPRTDAPITNGTGVTSSTKSGVRFGTGNRPASKDDYALAEMLLSGITVTKYNKVLLNPKDGVYSYLAQFIVKNTTQSELNIWEIGYYGQICHEEGNFDTYSDVLFERTVLDKPVTIPPGESRLISYKITFNHVLSGE